MRKIAFVYPGSEIHDALDNWVRALARHAQTYQIRLCRQAIEVQDDECGLIVTEATNYPRKMVDCAIGLLRTKRIPFGVLHNNDSIPTPGKYPSFCWTLGAYTRLEEYNPILLRQPLFPAIVPFEAKPLLVGTFGHVEPKKHIRQMHEWARGQQIPFRAFGCNPLIHQYADFIEKLLCQGCRISFHRWTETIEEWAERLQECSHFLFVLPESKGGTGGSPTSPRFAGFFNRPVIVIDDEWTFLQDRFHVFPSLEHLKKEALAAMEPPDYSWSPDVYLAAVLAHVDQFWRTHELA